MIMVNGQTGKVAGGVPWNRGKLWPRVVGAAVLSLLLYAAAALMFNSIEIMSFMLTNVWMWVICIALFMLGIVSFRKVSGKLSAGDPDLFSFVRRRR